MPTIRLLREHLDAMIAHAREVAPAECCGLVGGLSSRPDLVAQFVKMGALYVSTGTDLGFLMAECQRRVKQVRDIFPG